MSHDFSEIEKQVKAYLEEKEEAAKASQLQKISAALKKILRQAKRLKIQPVTALQHLRFLESTLWQHNAFLKSQAALDLLPYCFKLVFYQNHRLFIPALDSQEEEKEESKDTSSRRYFASKLYFLKDLSHLEQNALPQWEEDTKEQEELKSRINAISDWMVCKILLTAKPKDTLWALTDLMMKPVKSSKQVARIILCFSVLFRRLTRKMARFLSGTLFIIGGYLRNEAKSYLKKQFPESIVESGQNIRDINEQDRLFFEDGAMLRCCQYLVFSLALLGQNGLTSSSMDLYLSISRGEEIKEEQKQKGDQLQAVHYSLLSFFDIMQYLLAFLMSPTLSVEASSDQDQKEQESKQEVQMKWNYQIEGTQSFMKTLVSSITYISSNWMLLYEFWRGEGHRAPEQQEEGKNSYQKEDVYNSLGFATYMGLYYLEGLSGMWSHQFQIRIMLPVIQTLIQANNPKNRNYQILAITCLQKLFKDYVATKTEIPDIGQKQELLAVLLKLLDVLGAHDLSNEGKNVPQLNKNLALLFKGILATIVPKLAVQLYEELLCKIDNDRAEAFVLDCLRMDSRDLLNAESAKKILDFALYLRKEMLLEELERVSAAAQLLTLLLLRQAHSGKEVVSQTEAKRMKSEYLVPIRERIEVMKASKEKKEDPAQLENKVDLLRESLKRLCEELIS